MNMLLDLDRLEQSLERIQAKLDNILPDIVPIERGGTGVTTVENIKKLITGLSTKIIYPKGGQGQYSTVMIKPNLEANYEGASSGIYSVIIGQSACDLTKTADGINESVAIGYCAAKNVHHNGGMVVIGAHALETSVYTGNDMVVIGYEAGYSLSSSTGTPGGSTIVGYRAARFCSKANASTIIGDEPLYNIQAEVNNSVYIGHRAGYASGTVTGTSINENVMIGYFAGKDNAAGSRSNTAVGYGALACSGSMTMSQNTAVGANTGMSAAYSNCTLLGNSAMVSGNAQVQLGNSYTTTYAYGAVQNRSDERDKTNITDLDYDYKSFIMGLRPVNFQWDMRDDYRPIIDIANDNSFAIPLSDIVHTGEHIRNRRHNGFIAQEVKQLMDSLNFDFAGYQDHSISGGDDVLSLGYEEFIPPLIKLVQDQQQEIDSLKTQIANMDQRIIEIINNL